MFRGEGLRVEDVLKLVLLALASCQQAADPQGTASFSAGRDSSAPPASRDVDPHILGFEALAGGSWQQLQLAPRVWARRAARSLPLAYAVGAATSCRRVARKDS